MITAVFYKDPEGNFKSFTISGHAEFADEGQDIVCAAVTALSFNTVNAIEKLTGAPLKYDADVDGHLVCTLQEAGHQDAQLLIQALVLGLKQIRDSYGKEYLRIQTKAVRSTIEI